MHTLEHIIALNELNAFWHPLSMNCGGNGEY